MKKKTMNKTVAMAMFVGCVGLAGAQTNGPVGISARVGAFFPTNNLAKDLGNTWFGFGADYKLNSINMNSAKADMPSYLSISADYYEKNGLHGIPVALNYNVRSGQLVFAAGLGVDFDQIFGNATTGFGGQVAATYEFNKSGSTNQTPFFVQAKYFFANKTELSGLGVFLGVRF